MSKKDKITVQGTEIVLFSHKKEDYISLTDMAKYKNAEATGLVISHWLSTRYTIRFMGIWEQINNPDFNVTEFGNIKNESGDNGFLLTSKQWVERTCKQKVPSENQKYFYAIQTNITETERRVADGRAAIRHQSGAFGLVCRTD